jgi:hypothetical protein
MISVIKNTKTAYLAKPFPKMMCATDGLIVYFTKPKVGLVIKDKDYSFGYMSDSWIDSRFTDFEGVVELRNDWVESI